MVQSRDQSRESERDTVTRVNEDVPLNVIIIIEHAHRIMNINYPKLKKVVRLKPDQPDRWRRPWQQ